MDIVAGVDIGGTKTKIGLVTKEGECLEQTYFRTREYPDIEEFLNKIHSTINELIKQNPEDFKVLGVGVGAPNASSKNGTIENASNLLWKGTVPILEKMQKRISVPMKI